MRTFSSANAPSKGADHDILTNKQDQPGLEIVDQQDVDSKMDIPQNPKSLLFVQKNPLLRQVYHREVDDGIYPALKRPIDYWTIQEL